MNGDLLRIVEMLHRQKDIPKEIIFQGIEAAVASATKKHFGSEAEIDVHIDRESGKLSAFENDTPIDPEELGRIAAQSAKQMMIQKIREAERDSLYLDYEDRVGTIMTGTVQRYESGNLIATLEKVECVLSKRDLIPGDSYRPGDTIRAAVIDVRKVGQKVQIVLSRTCDEFVLRLFELEVPEINEGLVEVKGIARIPGYRTKVAIQSNDSRIDSVGACVGVRGARIRNVVGELNGEKIDIIEWNDAPEMLIVNALKPAEVIGLEIDDASHSARAIVADDQLSLAIGKRGQNVKLATKLTGWKLEIVTQRQDIAEHEAFLQDLVEYGGVDKSIADKMIEAGYESVDDVVARGPQALAVVAETGEDAATEIIETLKQNIDACGKRVAPQQDVSEQEQTTQGASTQSDTEQIDDEDKESQKDQAARQPGKDEI